MVGGKHGRSFILKAKAEDEPIAKPETASTEASCVQTVSFENPFRDSGNPVQVPSGLQGSTVPERQSSELKNESGISDSTLTTSEFTTTTENPHLESQDVVLAQANQDSEVKNESGISDPALTTSAPMNLLENPHLESQGVVLAQANQNVLAEPGAAGDPEQMAQVAQDMSEDKNNKYTQGLCVHIRGLPRSDKERSALATVISTNEVVLAQNKNEALQQLQSLSSAMLSDIVRRLPQTDSVATTGYVAPIFESDGLRFKTKAPTAAAQQFNEERGSESRPLTKVTSAKPPSSSLPGQCPINHLVPSQLPPNPKMLPRPLTASSRGSQTKGLSVKIHSDSFEP
jgi:hypothetical protein